MTEAFDDIAATTTLTLNGRAMAWSDGCGELARCLDPAALRAGGGVLMRAAVSDGSLWVNISPNFLNGRRCYHYDMALPESCGVQLTGDLTPNPAAALLFSPGAIDSDPAHLRAICVLLARALLAASMPPGCPLTAVSRQGLREVGAFDDPPDTLGDLSRRSPNNRED